MHYKSRFLEFVSSATLSVMLMLYHITNLLYCSKPMRNAL